MNGEEVVFGFVECIYEVVIGKVHCVVSCAACGIERYECACYLLCGL